MSDVRWHDPVWKKSKEKDSAGMWSVYNIRAFHFSCTCVLPSKNEGI